MVVHKVTGVAGGVVLLVALPVLLLVTLVVVAFLSLAVGTSRASAVGRAQEEARANARLGLMVAIGELQRELGPDRRIAVTGAIMDADPETPEVEGVRNLHWTGSVSTVFGDHRNGSPFIRDMSAGGLRDARRSRDARLSDLVQNYLVSGNEGGPEKMAGPREFQDAITTEVPSGDETVELVSHGSAADPQDFVRVHKTTISAPRRAPEGPVEPQRIGSYAYWVYPDNQKAHLGRFDRHQDSAIDHRTGGGLQRMVHPQDVEPSVLAGIAPMEQKRDERVLTPGSLVFLDEENHQAVRRYFHQLTGYSASVLANVRDGDLKKNLSAFLHGGGGQNAPIIDNLGAGRRVGTIGLSPTDRLVGAPNASHAALREENFQSSAYREVAPTFELLWQWAQLAHEFKFGQASTAIRPPQSWGSASFRNGGADPNLRPVDPRNLSRVKLTPVVTEASVYYNLATYPLHGRTSGGENDPTRPTEVLRLCLYPRVGLWNPYNIEMRVDHPLALQLLVNGKKRVEFDGDPGFSREIHFGGRSEAFDDWLGGRVILFLPPVILPPGETVIFSMGGPPRELALADLKGNRLQVTDPPSSSSYLFRDYLQEELDGAAAGNAQDRDEMPSELLPTAPTSFREAPTDFKRHGADELQFVLKSLVQNAANPSPHRFADEPTLVFANVSLQAGGGDEYPLEWPAGISAPVHRLGGPDDHLGDGFPPHPYSRDGFRIRWLEETRANKADQNERFLQEAPLGNWNLRASSILRTPYDNVTSKPPYFHGIYTRDNPSEALAWSKISPILKNGVQTGFPFGPPDPAIPRVVAFEVPTGQVGIPSLAYLRHLSLSEYVWHPAYAIGQAIADPRVKTTGTVPAVLPGENHGWSAAGLGTRYWAQLYNDMLFHLSEDNHLVFDLAFEVNHNLWSDYFLTGATPERIVNFAQDPVGHPLPNGNLRLWEAGGNAADDLNDFFRAAGRLLLEGGFDVHSTNKEAWKALLATTRDTAYASAGRTPFPRTFFPKGEENEHAAYSPRVFTGFRSLGDQEIDSLAEAIVREVKVRAPFFGLSDFVNRRLADDDTGRNGTLGAALEASLPNRGLKGTFPIARSPLPDQGPLIAEGNPRQSDLTRSDPMLKPPSSVYGMPGSLTQGDLLQVIGSGLVARSDTFTIRTYGESLDAGGKVLARAWCEATVQRTPRPVRPDLVNGLNPRIPQGGEIDFGRRFELISFRWLHPDEI